MKTINKRSYIGQTLRHFRHERIRVPYYYEQTAPGEPVSEDKLKAGCKVYERKTYVIDDLSDIDTLTHSFSENKRRQIKKAEHLQFSDGLSVSEFYDLNETWFRLRGRKIEYTKDYFVRLAGSAIEHGSGRVIVLKGQTGDVYAAAFIVYDDQTCYYLVPGFNPLYANSGAGARLVAEALRAAKQHGCKRFDFEGGNNSSSVARHYSEFASKEVTYYGYEKYYSLLFRLLYRIYKYIHK